jgi:hypothetical protein
LTFAVERMLAYHCARTEVLTAIRSFGTML